MTSPESSPRKATLCLQIRGVGHVKSFKNHKRIAGKRLITRPDVKKQMQKITNAFALQLFCAWQTQGDVMLMGHSQRSWIATFWPLDDSVREIPEITIRCVQVDKGEEGADILIEEI